jgi:hypothetical protein
MVLFRKETGIGREISSGRVPAKAVNALLEPRADTQVFLPASENKEDATYTFEAEYEGITYRWTGQRPQLRDGQAFFDLRDGVPV